MENEIMENNGTEQTETVEVDSRALVGKGVVIGSAITIGVEAVIYGGRKLVKWILNKINEKKNEKDEENFVDCDIQDDEEED